MRRIRQTIRRRCHGSPRPRHQNHRMVLDDRLARPELRRYRRLRRCPYRQEIRITRGCVVFQGYWARPVNIRLVIYIHIYIYMTVDIAMDSLREFYQKYDEIVKYSAYAFAGWFLSWVLFFIMLPFMARAYGKIRGASLNYAFSWFSMIAIILGLEFGLR